MNDTDLVQKIFQRKNVSAICICNKKKNTYARDNPYCKWPHGERSEDWMLVCPDCGGPTFVLGPRGGNSQNIKCSTCGSEFNICPPYFAERIGGRKDAKREIESGIC